MNLFQAGSKPNYLRGCITFVLLFILIMDICVYQKQPTGFDLLILAVLLIFGLSDRFEVIKIPGFIELNDKTTNIDKKLDQLTQKLQKLEEKEEKSEKNAEKKV